jgi:hypothetical protein
VHCILSFCKYAEKKYGKYCNRGSGVLHLKSI